MYTGSNNSVTLYMTIQSSQTIIQHFSWLNSNIFKKIILKIFMWKYTVLHQQNNQLLFF